MAKHPASSGVRITAAEFANKNGFVDASSFAQQIKQSIGMPHRSSRKTSHDQIMPD
jgi:hypothetical protein